MHMSQTEMNRERDLLRYILQLTPKHGVMDEELFILMDKAAHWNSTEQDFLNYRERLNEITESEDSKQRKYEIERLLKRTNGIYGKALRSMAENENGK